MLTYSIIIRGIGYILALVLLGGLYGCGGGGGDSPQSQTRVNFAIDWPAPTRTIPPETQSIAIELYTGATLLDKRMINCPAQGGCTNVQFTTEVQTALRYSATAYPNANCTGVPLGTAQEPLETKPGGKANITLALSMNSAIATMEVAAPEQEITVGGSIICSAAAKDASGRVVLANLHWTTSNAAVASVSSTGKVVGVKPGSALITARHEASGKSGNVTITVAPLTNAISITPTSSPLVVGQAITLTATARDAVGNPVATTFAWSSSNTKIATVDDQGKVTGVAPGAVTITAVDTKTGKNARATITVWTEAVSVVISPSRPPVIAVGASIALTATAYDASGKPTEEYIIWSSAEPQIAAVNSLGKVTGVAAGITTITATDRNSGKEASVTVTVSANSRSVSVSPSTPVITVGTRITLTATARDASGQPIAANFTWETANANIATVSSAGEVTGVAAGSVTITATDINSGSSGFATVTVKRGEPPVGEGHIVFESDKDGNLEIYLMRSDGGGLTRLTSNAAQDTSPMIGYGGSAIVFESTRDGGDTDIFVMNTSGDNLRQITRNAAQDIEPALSVDGRYIAYASNADGDFDIYIYDLQAGTSRQITNDPAEDTHPFFNDDGSQLVFVSDRGGNKDIYIMNASGSGIQQLTYDSYEDNYPVFNRQGTQIAFISKRIGDHTSHQTYLINPDGSGEQRLLQNVIHCSRMPSFSPDGSQLVCAGNPDRNFDLYLSSVSNPGLNLIYASPGREMHASWGP